MNSFLAKIYLYSFFDELIFIYPLYAVMFVDHGLSALEISALLTVWSLTVFALEVPSGVLADKYSRKNILFLGQLIRAGGYASWLFFPTFPGFLVGFVLWGIEGAFSSGTFEALVFDELKRGGREAVFTRVLGRAHSLGLVAIIAASAGATAAISLGYGFVLEISIGSVLIASALLLLLPRAPRAGSTRERAYFALLKEGIGNAIHRPGVLHLLVFVSLGLALAGALDEYWPIFACEAGLPRYALGLFLAMATGAQALGSAIAYRFEHFSRRFFYAVFALNGVLVLIAALLMRPSSVLLIVVFSFSFKIVEVVFAGRLQRAIPSDTRATISSVRGFFVEIGAIGMYLGMGGMARVSSYRIGVLCFGLVIVFTGLLYWLSSHGERSRPDAA